MSTRIRTPFLAKVVFVAAPLMIVGIWLVLGYAAYSAYEAGPVGIATSVGAAVKAFHQAAQ